MEKNRILHEEWMKWPSNGGINFCYEGIKISVFLLSYICQSCLKRDLGMTETCLERKKILVTRIRSTNTCIKRNLFLIEKMLPLRFRY
jgi:hypothetical protein